MDCYTPFHKLPNAVKRGSLDAFFTNEDMGDVASPGRFFINPKTGFNYHTLTISLSTLLWDGYQARVRQSRSSSAVKVYFYHPTLTMTYRFDFPAHFCTNTFADVAYALSQRQYVKCSIFHSPMGVSPAPQAGLESLLRASNDALAAQLPAPKTVLPSAQVVDLAAVRALTQKKA